MSGKNDSNGNEKPSGFPEGSRTVLFVLLDAHTMTCLIDDHISLGDEAGFNTTLNRRIIVIWLGTLTVTKKNDNHLVSGSYRNVLSFICFMNYNIEKKHFFRLYGDVDILLCHVGMGELKR